MTEPDALPLKRLIDVTIVSTGLVHGADGKPCVSLIVRDNETGRLFETAGAPLEVVDVGNP